MRTVVSDGPDGLTFVVPSRRQWFAILFVPVWLIGWMFGEVLAIKALIGGKGPSLFMVTWLTMWTVGGGLAALGWLWMVVGKERLIVKPGLLVHRFELFSLRRTREYDLSQVRNLKVSPESFNPWNMGGGLKMWGLGGGVVAFDYGARTIRVAGSVDEAEGRMIVSRIQERCAIPNSAG
jgi:hypothetical protein